MTPCFHYSTCRSVAELEKNGKSLCRRCATRVSGREYPLRTPAREPLYWTNRDVAEALGLAAPRRRLRATNRRPQPVSASADAGAVEGA